MSVTAPSSGSAAFPLPRAAAQAERRGEESRIDIRGHIFRIISSAASSELIPACVRRKILQAMGFQLASDTCIWAKCSLRSNRMRTAACVFINIGFYYDGYEMLEIGRNVRIGPFVRIVTASHKIGPPTQRAPKEVIGGPVRIEDGCWIGTGVTILPDVTIAKGCVVAAGSLVTRSTKPNGLYMGVPARRVRELDTFRADIDEHDLAGMPHFDVV
jgi:maltose O-acetyltransferase